MGQSGREEQTVVGEAEGPEVCTCIELSPAEYQGLICHNKISMSTAKEA